MIRKMVFLAFVAASVTAAAFAAPPVQSTWGRVKVIYRDPAPASSAITLPQASETSRPNAIRKPGAESFAVPPSFPGWSVVSGSKTVIFGPIWDQDWKIYFYIPNSTRLPPYRVLAAKNLAGTWLDYTKYGLLYDYGQSGSYYRVVYVFGGWRANAFGINMFDATNWALYYHY